MFKTSQDHDTVKKNRYLNVKHKISRPSNFSKYVTKNGFF